MKWHEAGDVCKRAQMKQATLKTDLELQDMLRHLEKDTGNF